MRRLEKGQIRGISACGPAQATPCCPANASRASPDRALRRGHRGAWGCLLKISRLQRATCPAPLTCLPPASYKPLPPSTASSLSAGHPTRPSLPAHDLTSCPSQGPPTPGPASACPPCPPCPEALCLAATGSLSCPSVNPRPPFGCCLTLGFLASCRVAVRPTSLRHSAFPSGARGSPRLPRPRSLGHPTAGAEQLTCAFSSATCQALSLHAPRNSHWPRGHAALGRWRCAWIVSFILIKFQTKSRVKHFAIKHNSILVGLSFTVLKMSIQIV